MPYGCKSERHLCQVILEGNGIEKIKKMSRKWKYICQKCDRVSSLKKYLCDGIVIQA